ncbi:MAG: hypothetical protein H6739_10950 [Alphaproteobacteria bacterium]|nr:hypothetical protein [Alphaproteobacteria bacterium]
MRTSLLLLLFGVACADKTPTDDSAVDSTPPPDWSRAVVAEVTTLTTDLDGADGLVRAADGGFYVTEPQQGRVKRVALDGTVTPWVEGLLEGYGASLAPDGALLVAEWGRQRVARIAPDGEVTSYYDLGGRVGNVYVDPEGAVLVPWFYGSKVEQVTAEGVATTIAQSVEFNGLHGVMVGYDGDLFFANHIDGKIFRADGAGGVTLFAQLPDRFGNLLFFEGALYATGWGDHTLYRIDAEGALEALAGADEPDTVDGDAETARFENPNGLVGDAEAHVLYVSQTAGAVRVVRLEAP